MLTEKTKSPDDQQGRAAVERYAAREAAGSSPGEMKSAIVKRSIELHGHKTSVSLEDEFWHALRAIAAGKELNLPVLLQKIDAERGGANLSSAIRVYVLGYYRSRAKAQADDQAATGEPLRS